MKGFKRGINSLIGRMLLGRNIKITNCTGLLFQIQGSEPTDELWRQCKIEAFKRICRQLLPYNPFPTSYGDGFFVITMPCGCTKTFRNPTEIMDLPIKDIPCSCGDKTHWFVRFVASDNNIVEV